MKASAFFYANAGYSYNPKTETRNAGRWRYARELAAAESHMALMGWAAVWEWEPYFDHGDLGCERTDDHEHDVVYCVLKTADGRVLASLGCIDESKNNRERDNYRRVVAAELASEAMASIPDAMATVFA